MRMSYKKQFYMVNPKRLMKVRWLSQSKLLIIPKLLIYSVSTKPRHAVTLRQLFFLRRQSKKRKTQSCSHFRPQEDSAFAPVWSLKMTCINRTWTQARMQTYTLAEPHRDHKAGVREPEFFSSVDTRQFTENLTHILIIYFKAHTSTFSKQKQIIINKRINRVSGPSGCSVSISSHTMH